MNSVKKYFVSIIGFILVYALMGCEESGPVPYTPSGQTNRNYNEYNVAENTNNQIPDKLQIPKDDLSALLMIVTALQSENQTPNVYDFHKLIERGKRLTRKLEATRNPFAEVKADVMENMPESEDEYVDFKLSGIFYDESNPLAIIDGKVVGEGALLKDKKSRVEKIYPKKVIIRLKRKKIILKLEE